MPVNIKPTGDAGAKKASPYEDHFGDTVAKAAPIKKTTEVIKKTGGEEQLVSASDETEPGVVVPLHRLAHVSVQGGRTINIGNYESIKIGVTITLPCDVDDLHEAYAAGLEFVDAKVSELKDAIENGEG